MNRFICKHYNVLRWLLSTVYAVVTITVTAATRQYWLVWIFTALYLLLAIVGIGLAPNRMLKPVLAKCNETCDPYPMLEVMETLLTCRLPKKTRAVALVDYAVALQDTGDLHRAYDVMRTVDIQGLRLPPVSQFIYYNNMAGYCTRLNRIEEADGCYAHQRQLYETLPKAYKTKMNEFMLHAAALDRFRHGDSHEAMRILETVPHKTRAAKVSGAMLYARAAVRVGDREKARENLQYVVNYGGRFAVVEEAKAMLNALPCEEV